MRVPNWISFLSIMAAVAIGTFIAIAVTDVATLKAGWCDGRPSCLRDWIGALSGWAATIAAAITIIFLFRQNEEQKKQTDFLLGEARPSIDALQHLHRREEVVVRVVNWNRRPIVLRAIRIPGLHGDVALKRASIKDRESPKEGLKSRRLHESEIEPPIAMHGWKNRSDAPCEVRLDLVGRKPLEPFIEKWTDLLVEVDILIAGEDGDSMTLRCPIAVAE